MSSLNGDSAASTTGRSEVERGLQFANVMLTVTQNQAEETAAHMLALTELLVQKGLIGEEELMTALARNREEMADIPAPRVRLSDMGDKYAEDQNVEIDCAARLHLCQARCCTFAFFLSKQDLDEGVARWDYGNPYWIRQGPDGYCVHSDSATRACTIHAQRPHVCRRYDCRRDQRVWIDFDARIPAPLPDPQGQRPVAMAEVVLQHQIRVRHDAETNKLVTDEATEP